MFRHLLDRLDKSEILPRWVAAPLEIGEYPRALPEEPLTRKMSACCSTGRISEIAGSL